MIRLIRSIAHICAILISAAVQPTVAAGTAITVNNGVIFSAEKTAEVASRIDISEPYWTPTEQDIERVEHALLKYVRLHSNDATKPIASRLSEYRRQYLGYSVNGEKLILINAFCKDFWQLDSRWHSEFVDVLDGGDCYFQIRYKVSSSEFFELEFNGEA